jgi:hypothetical protein
LNSRYKNEQLGLIFAKANGLEDLFMEKVSHLIMQGYFTKSSVGHQRLCLCSIRPWSVKRQIQ